MFNGIIKHTGKINKINKNNNNCLIEISSKIKLSKKEIGSSIACSGTCLTLKNYKNNLINFYISKETLKKTIFQNSLKGDIVNLEKSLRYGDRVSGHFVQGHIDTTCKVKKIINVGKSWYVSFKLSKKFKKNLVFKGSITINGVSLTISEILMDGFQVVIIPQTLKNTNLIKLKKNDLVNVEFDILGKYIKKIIK